MSYAYNAATATAAMAHIQSVEYPVGLRWVFYRLLQDGVLKSKDDYLRLKDILGIARKELRDGWTPATLIDDGRSISTSPRALDGRKALDMLPHYVTLRADLFSAQEAVPFLIYESATSDGQFQHFARWADRAALRGDASIPHKWAIAQRCDELAALYALPVQVLYFGDYDAKGRQIPESAFDDIRKWIAPTTELRFTRIGINADHAERFSLPEKPEKPGTYEWEALDSDDASALIAEALALAVDVADVERRMDAATAASEVLRVKVQRALAKVNP